MRIISKFKDFYDSASGLGIDTTVRYVRATDELPKLTKQDPLRKLLESFPHNYTSSSISIYPGLLLICGSVVPYVQVHAWVGNTRSETLTFYQYDKFQDFASSCDGRLGNYFSFWGGRHSVYSMEGVKKFLENKDFLKLSELHHKYKAPVIKVETDNHYEAVITRDPVLKNLAYQTQKDPFTTFQDIFMYITGVLGINENPMIQVSDKIKASKYGHDGEYSFKNVPGKKRGR